MKKNPTTNRDFFAIKTAHVLTDDELITLSEICTMSTIKYALQRNYTPYLDALRRTWTQTQRAKDLENIINQMAELEELYTEEREELAELEEELAELNEKRTNILLDPEQRAELDQIARATHQEIKEQTAKVDALREDTATMRQTSTKELERNFTDLADSFSAFRVGYLEHTPTAEELATALEKVLGTDESQNEYQKENRAQWEEMNPDERAKALAHIVKIKRGKNAVKRHISFEGSRSADYSQKMVSFFTVAKAMTDGAKDDTTPDETRALDEIISKTLNTAVDSQGAGEHIQAFYKLARLTQTQRRFCLHYMSKSAINEGATAHAKYYETESALRLLEKGQATECRKRANNAEFKARRAYAWDKIGVKGSDKQSHAFDKLKDKLRKYYNLHLEDIANAYPPEPKSQTKRRKLNQTKREYIRIDEHKLTCKPSGAVLWIPRAETLEREENRLNPYKNAPTIIPDPDRATLERAELERHQNHQSQNQNRQNQTRAELEEMRQAFAKPSKSATPTTRIDNHQTERQRTYLDQNEIKRKSHHQSQTTPRDLLGKRVKLNQAPDLAELIERAKANGTYIVIEEE